MTRPAAGLSQGESPSATSPAAPKLLTLALPMKVDPDLYPVDGEKRLEPNSMAKVSLTGVSPSSIA
jgi:hypothetical protein